MLRFIMTVALLAYAPSAFAQTQTFSAQIVDAKSEQPIEARVYLQRLGDQPTWLHVQSRDGGEAIEYHKDRGGSVEIHTSVSRHGFQVDLAPGEYRLTIERGKEYVTYIKAFTMNDAPATWTLPLERWIDMSSKGWFSGETHTHRTLADLPTAMLAEDLNVAFPLTYWVTDSRQTPARNRRSQEPVPAPELVEIDPTHVYWPVNTEYEIFTIDGKRHTLGALFFLNHRNAIDLAAPPIVPVVESLRDEPAVLTDMDKHNWPWSMMLVPTTGVQLFELSNNHIWRTEFKFGDWYPNYVPEFLDVERTEDGNFTERGWIDYGLGTYYMLLNCGYRIWPTGGTASGVHPVPIGFGRVYVHLGKTFDYEKWVAGLASGRSFVTTGPMMDVRFSGKLPGESFAIDDVLLMPNDAGRQLRISGSLLSDLPFDRVEYVVNGQAVPIDCEPIKRANVWTIDLDFDVPVDESLWIAVRCFTKTDSGRLRFAHSAPVFVTDESNPMRPPREAVAFLVRRMEEEIDRHEGVLTEEAIDEFRAAKAAFESLLQE